MSERLSASAAQHTSEEIFPAISVDIAYGKYVDDFEVNTDRITQYLRDGGLDDDQISEISIRFSAEPPEEDGDRITTGNYAQATRRITVNHSKSIAAIPRFDNEESVKKVNDAARNTLVHELEHAVAYHDPKQQATNAAYRRKILWQEYLRGLRHNYMIGAFAVGIAAEYFTDTPYVFGASILAGSIAQIRQYRHDSKHHAPGRRHQQYLNNPEEIRARNAADAAPADIMSITVADPLAEARKYIADLRESFRAEPYSAPHEN